MGSGCVAVVGYNIVDVDAAAGCRYLVVGRHCYTVDSSADTQWDYSSLANAVVVVNKLVNAYTPHLHRDSFSTLSEILSNLLSISNLYKT